MGLDKNRDKHRMCFPSLRLALHSDKALRDELSTALYECEAVARCATRKTDTAINRIKTVNALKLWLLLRNMDTAINIKSLYHKRHL